MTNRSSTILLPYNLSDTNSSSSSSSLTTPHELYWSASSSSRRIMPSSPPSSSSCSPFTSTAATTTTTNSSSSPSHCLRIDSLRHDPVHFIPAYFAELNLPPPASIWTMGREHEANSSVLWFMYHDALAVRSLPFPFPRESLRT